MAQDHYALQLTAQDLRFLANAVEHHAQGDGPELPIDDPSAYIAADTPPIPIWRMYSTADGRILIGHLVKDDHAVWSFRPLRQKLVVDQVADPMRTV